MVQKVQYTGGRTIFGLLPRAAAWVLLLSALTSADDGRSVIKSDEKIEFFPTAARLTDDGQTWVVPVHGWIYEPEAGDLLRRATVSSLRRVVGPPRGSEHSQLFDQRVRRFLVDNERGKRVAIELAGETFVLPASTENGHFQETLHLPAARVAAGADGNILLVRAALPNSDERSFTGRIMLVGREGVTIVSDIDDTVKLTDVTDSVRMMQRTFHEPFEAVPGMAEVYRRWSGEGAHLHFLSGSPWQLQSPLEEMLRQADFPPSSFDLRLLRLKDFSALEFTRDSSDFKKAAITSLFASWPQRRYLLVGDSGERDPEIYGEIARRFPERVLLIAIRDVTGQPADAPRYREAFRTVPGDRWMIFTDPAQLPDLNNLLSDPG